MPEELGLLARLAGRPGFTDSDMPDWTVKLDLFEFIELLKASLLAPAFYA